MCAMHAKRGGAGAHAWVAQILSKEKFSCQATELVQYILNFGWPTSISLKTASTYLAAHYFALT